MLCTTLEFVTILDILFLLLQHAWANDLMTTEFQNLSSHMCSLAMTEMDWVASNQVEASTVINHEVKHQNIRNTESDISLRSDGGISSLLAKRTTNVQEQLHQFRNFLGQPNTQSSVAGPSCATTTSVHSTSAPMLNSTTNCSHLYGGSHVSVEASGDFNVNPQPVTHGNVIQPSIPSFKDTGGELNDKNTVAVQTSKSASDNRMEVKEHELSREKQGCVPKESSFSRNPSLLDDKPVEGRKVVGDATDGQPQVPLAKDLSSDVKLEPSKVVKQDKVASGKGASAPRKRNYDPDLFFKVNGKLYQRLGKIGSGGSSEVHKVISSDCTIYALKKIKLKGRDYATAYGFCQEIEYLNRLKGKRNIIQLIDYEVLTFNSQLFMQL